MAKHYNGPKLRGSHTTYIDGAEKVIKQALKEPSITGILLGEIKQGGKIRGIECKQVGSNRLVTKVRSSGSIQIITFYTTNFEKMTSVLKNVF